MDASTHGAPGWHLGRLPALSRSVIVAVGLLLPWGEVVTAGPQWPGPAVRSVLVTLAGGSSWSRLDAATRRDLMASPFSHGAGSGAIVDLPTALDGAVPGTRAPAAEALARRRAMTVDQQVIAAQEPEIAAARRLGVDVVGRYSAAANGFLAHATDDEIARLARLPGVVRVESAPRWRLAAIVPPSRPLQERARSLMPTGSPAPERRPSSRPASAFQGEGSVVAIVDTGIDYTHADFGGPGTPEAYQAAQADDTSIADTWQGRPLFPTAKVIGGYDFVGANYTSPPSCPPEQARSGACTSEPHPDLDPLDRHNHGSHVAGIAAGQGTPLVPAGVAPAARLVALKVYGPPANGQVDEAVDVVVDAIEWCTRVNMGLAVPGTPPPNGAKIDVINMSLGEEYGQGSRLFDEAAAAASEAGITVVASAGNSGDNPYVLGAPGASPAILSVAAADPAVVGGEGGQTSIGVIAGYSSRGPSRNGALKPDIAAPGTNIVSAARGSGNGPLILGGTSMASPHAAGAAALVAERNRIETLGLDGTARASLLMNYATADVRFAASTSAQLAPVVRQGSGRVDVAGASRGRLLMRPVGAALASLQLGPLALTAPQSFTRTIRVQSLADEDLLVSPLVRLTSAEDAQGLTVTVPDEPLRLPARDRIAFDAVFTVDPSRVPVWLLQGNPLTTSDLYDRQALEGRLGLAVQTSAGQPLPDEPTPSLPFSVLPRAASRFRPTYPAPPAPGEESPGAVVLQNDAFAGWSELFMLPEGVDQPADVSPDDELPLRWSAVRYEMGNGDPRLAFGLVARQPWSIPEPVSTEIFLDTDLDGRPDLRLRLANTSYLGGQVNAIGRTMEFGVTPWDGERAAPAAPERRLPAGAVDIHTRVLIFAVASAALGLLPGAPFDYYIVRRGTDENWLRPPALAVAPAGADQPGGPRYRVRPSDWGAMPDIWSVFVAAHDAARVPMRATGSTGGAFHWPSLLMLMPQGELGAEDGQALVLRPPALRWQIYAPLGAKRSVFRPAGR